MPVRQASAPSRNSPIVRGKIKTCRGAISGISRSRNASTSKKAARGIDAMRLGDILRDRAVPGHNPGGGKACIAQIQRQRTPARPHANNQRGPNRNGSTMNPASAYSVRMSPFQIRHRWTRPNTSSTASRRTSSTCGVAAGRSRSNWMARPTPNSSENSANAFRSTPSVRIVSTVRSSGEQGSWRPETARKSKREIPS